MKYLVSRDNPTFKRLLALAHDARERRKLSASLLDGPHLIEAAQAAGIELRRVAVAESALQNEEIAGLVAGLDENHVHILKDAMLREISPVETPVGIVAEIALPQSRHPVEVPARDLLVLEALQDPGNLGTILRTAAAVGIEEVWLSTGSAQAWGPKVLRAAMGAHFRLDIREHVNVYSLLKDYDGWVVATHLDASAIALFESDLKPPTVWLFGSEGHGLSSTLSDLADQLVRLPMPGEVESLNVAVAVGVCLYEQYRQRLSRTCDVQSTMPASNDTNLQR